MNRSLVISLLVGCFLVESPLIQAQVPYPDLELVESIPEGTDLDSADIRNTQQVWLEMINGAKKTLDIEQFYISTKNNQALEPILSSILEAARRGVQVRVVADASYYRYYKKGFDRLKTEKGIEARLIDLKKITGDGVQHAKFFIVDGAQVFLGSQNFDWRSLAHIREVGVRIVNPNLAAVLSRVFELDWALALAAEPKAYLKSYVQKPMEPVEMKRADGTLTKLRLLCDPKDVSPDLDAWDLAAILSAIGSAQKEIRIELLTYSLFAGKEKSWQELDQALRDAAGRGVSVKMIISDWSKRKPAVGFIQNLAQVKNIEIRFSTIAQLGGRFIPYARVSHAKFMTVDQDRAWIGSSNWEKNYFYGSRNIGLMIQDAKFTGRLSALFDKDWQSPTTYPVDPKAEYPPPRIRK